MNDFQKNLINKYIKQIHRTKDLYENMKPGTPLKEQVFLEQQFEYFRYFVADLISMYLGKDITDEIFGDTYDVETADELINKYVK